MEHEKEFKKSKIKAPRVVVAGIGSGVGKTIISAAIMHALKNLGYNVSGFKIGPDFIDPSYHEAVLGRKSRNLDSFLMSRRSIVESFSRAFAEENADMAIIEGVMGLYDGIDYKSEKASTAEVAKILKAPVLLVCDAKKVARSIAAIVLGYKLFDRNVNIRGVILNNVGSERHAEKLEKAIKSYCGLEVIGAIPRNSALKIPERHLGLIPAYELRKEIKEACRIAAEHLNLGKIISIAEDAGEIEASIAKSKRGNKRERKEKIRAGIIYDSIFRFYYAETIEEIASKAEKVFFINALKDKKLPDIDLLYIGGGFPEVFAEKLEKNNSLRNAIYDFCNSNKPCYAECGGLMYLGNAIETKEKEEFAMVGFLPLKTEMHTKPLALGYAKYEVIRDNIVSGKGEIIKGHEFHYSKAILLDKSINFAYRAIRGNGIANGKDGIMLGNTLASYIHLHPLGYKKMVDNLIKSAQRK